MESRVGREELSADSGVGFWEETGGLLAGGYR